MSINLTGEQAKNLEAQMNLMKKNELVEFVMKQTGLHNKDTARARVRKYLHKKISVFKLLEPLNIKNSKNSKCQHELNKKSAQSQEKVSQFIEMKETKKIPKKRIKRAKYILDPCEVSVQNQEYSDKNEFGKRGPLRPLYEDVLQITTDIETKTGVFPKSPIVVKTAKGSPRVCMLHYNRIVRERFELSKRAQELEVENIALKDKLQLAEEYIKTLESSIKSQSVIEESLSNLPDNIKDIVLSNAYNQLLEQIIEKARKHLEMKNQSKSMTYIDLAKGIQSANVLLELFDVGELSMNDARKLNKFALNVTNVSVDDLEVA